MNKSKKPYHKGKWNDKDNFVCNAKGCKFADLNEDRVKDHVEKKHGAIPEAKPTAAGEKPSPDSKKKDGDQ